MRYEEIEEARCDQRSFESVGGRARLLLLWLLGVPLPIILLIWLFAGNC